ncbi:hypothetical protein, partial [Acidiphilium sp. 20-67-58]|uniref:hypothetical protein n=1 Tax=Acidiphilium sp. 20-67-58 TaxID=1970291 RepID=UPI0025C149F2
LRQQWFDRSPLRVVQPEKFRHVRSRPNRLESDASQSWQYIKNKFFDRDQKRTRMENLFIFARLNIHASIGHIMVPIDHFLSYPEPFRS